MATSPPLPDHNDLENTTRILASDQGTATFSKLTRRGPDSPERSRRNAATTSKTPASFSSSSSSKTTTGVVWRGQKDGDVDGDEDDAQGGHLKIDEEAIRELSGLSRDESDAPGEEEEITKGIHGEQQHFKDRDAQSQSQSQDNANANAHLLSPPPSADPLPLERDTPASAGPSRAPSPRPPREQMESNSTVNGTEANELDHSQISIDGPTASSQSEATSLTSPSAPLPSVITTDATTTDRVDLSISVASDSGSEEEADDSDEEAEPSLKYQRLKGTVLDVVKKDSISTLAVSEKFLALGTHAGMVFIVDFQGSLIKGFRSHTASVLNIEIDTSMEFVAAAGMDGLVSISSLTSAEHYAFDFKRPMRAVGLEPNFGRRTSRAFVCGGMAGALIHREKGWLGHKESVLHGGEGPIWSCSWKGELIAWATDKGVRIYDTNTRQKITYISAPQGQATGALYRCNLLWQDGNTLIIAWADQIKVAAVREREAKAGGIVNAAGTSHPQLHVTVTKIFQLDCAISGIAPYGKDLLVLAYVTESEDEESEDEGPSDQDPSPQFRRRAGQRPELRIIDPATGREKSSDVLSIAGYERLNCNDYRLIASCDVPKRVGSRSSDQDATSQTHFYVVSPREIIVARPRDHTDHINWLLEQKKFESALSHIEALPQSEAKAKGFDPLRIGRDYLQYLTDETGDYPAAARAGSKILGQDAQAWESFVLLFLDRGKLDSIVDYIPIEEPVLSSIVYDMILAHYLQKDLTRLKDILDHWPIGIYSTQAVALAMEDRLQFSPTMKRRSHEQETRPWTLESNSEQTLLTEILADLYVRNHQPGKSLPYYLRLRRPTVFHLIREHNLFLDIRDQARQLIEFEDATRDKESSEEYPEQQGPRGQAVQLLVDHVHSIPVQRVVPQLETKSAYLHLYLDALFDKDPQLVTDYSDLQIELYADYGYTKLMSYLRAMSSYYSFEKAFRVCELHDYVPEMVFLLGRVGDNKRALNLIIERLQDVSRAIDFAKEQNDDDLWEDLLRYSENRPAFIRGLLENVGAEIDPIRLIRRIKDGLEITGLKPALIKILHDFNLQISLLEGCCSILDHDVRSLQQDLFQGQTQAEYCEPEVMMARGAGKAVVGTNSSSSSSSGSLCSACSRPLFSKRRQTAVVDGQRSVPPPSSFSSSTLSSESQSTSGVCIVFLCRHVYHLTCLIPKAANLPIRPREGQRGGARRRRTGNGMYVDFSVPLQMMTTTATQRTSEARVASVHSLDYRKMRTVDADADVDGTLLSIGLTSPLPRNHSAIGPASLRSAEMLEAFREKIKYSARVRAALRGKGGCPNCRSGSDGRD